MNIYIEKSRLTQFAPIVKFEEHSIFDTYDIQVIDGLIVSNIDLFIVGRHETYNELCQYGKSIKDKIIFTRQNKKSVNIAEINDLISRSGDFKILQHLDVIGSGNFDPSQYQFKPNTKYYVKLEHGARSINTFIVDSGLCSVAVVLAELKQINGKPKEVYKDTILKLSKTPGIQYIKGNTRYEDEEFEYREMHYYAHEALNDIVSEYRIIQSNAGKLFWVFSRERNSDNTGVVDNELAYTKHSRLDENLMEEIQRVAYNLDEFFFGSMDVVVNSEGKAAIVETSNQYGAGDIPNKLKTTILHQTLRSAIKQRASK